LDEILLLLLQVLLELVGDVILEVLAEFGLAAIKAALERPNRSLPLAAIGLFVLGAGLGGLSLLLWPARLWKPGPVRGLSLIVGPLCAGGAMQAWGNYRRISGHVTTSLATFAGGAAFAFGMTLVRFIWAG
jgi:hypothetical protein